MSNLAKSVVLMNKTLIMAYKATSNHCILEKRTELNWKHSYLFLPFDIIQGRFCLTIAAEQRMQMRSMWSRAVLAAFAG